MRLKNSSWFTFIELMIVITITFLMLTFVYLPYAHYQEKIKAKQVIREVSQWINEARNMAINGFDQTRTDWTTWLNLDDWINKSIGLYFSN
jgi:Tfp pilus assembly protein PilE